MKAQYEEGRKEALQKCLEAVWDICRPNGLGPYSEGQFEACEEVAKAIMELQRHIDDDLVVSDGVT